MRLILFLLVIILSNVTVHAMVMAKLDANAVEVRGIPRILPYEFHSFVSSIRYKYDRKPLLFVTPDFDDAKNIAQPIAQKHNLYLMFIDARENVFIKQQICPVILLHWQQLLQECLLLVAC